MPPIPYEAPASKTVGRSTRPTSTPSISSSTPCGRRVFAAAARTRCRQGLCRKARCCDYQPDKTNNYEAGLKGRFSNGLSYTVAVFDIKWDKPQISSSLPSGNLAVYNANTAESRGFEFESMGPAFLPRLSYSVGFAYADAKLTSNFALPANNGTGTIVPGLLAGTAGEQLPGSPKTSATAALIYDLELDVGLRSRFHGQRRLSKSGRIAGRSELGSTTVQHSSSFETMNLNAVLTHESWHFTAYVTNVFDKQEILAPPSQPNQVDNLTNDYLVNSPRTIELRFGYTF